MICRGLKLAGVGARIKQIGPIKAKVYAAGLYLDKNAATKAVEKLKTGAVKDFAESAELKSAVSLNIPLSIICRFTNTLLFSWSMESLTRR